MARNLDLTEWLQQPATRALLVLCQHRKAGPQATFLAGSPVDPVMQGRAAAYHHLAGLLTGPQEALQAALEEAINAEANRR